MQEKAMSPVYIEPATVLDTVKTKPLAARRGPVLTASALDSVLNWWSGRKNGSAGPNKRIDE